MSDFFAVDGITQGLKRIFLKIPAHPGGVIHLSGNANELLIVNVLEKEVSLVDTDLTLKGGIGPTNIIWNFPNAAKLVIMHSGSEAFGLIGAFIAPRAEVTFVNGRITGALFARKITGESDGPTCESSQTKGVQINGVCINGLISGIGCRCAHYHATAPAPSPSPIQTQSTDCHAGQRQSVCAPS